MFALDRFTKWLVETHVSAFDVYNVIPGFFDIVHSQNRGVAFGIFNDSTSAWRTDVLIVFVGGRGGAGQRACSGDAAAAGPDLAVGLGADPGRRGRQCVRPDRVGPGDRLPAISTSANYHWPTFNVADSAIVIGSGLLLLDLLRPKRQPAEPDASPNSFTSALSQSTYGVLVALAFLAGALAGRHAWRERRGLESQTRSTNLGIYCALAAIVGAKLMMFLVDIPYYAQHPGEIFSLATLQAGGVFYGGLIAALIVAVVVHAQDEPAAAADGRRVRAGHRAGPRHRTPRLFRGGLLLGPSDCHLPWAVTFTNPVANELVGVPLDVPLHPTQLYEAAAEFVDLRASSTGGSGKPHTPGRDHQPVPGALFDGALHRGVLPLPRAGESVGGPLDTSQWISLLFILLGAAYFARREQKQTHR